MGAAQGVARPCVGLPLAANLRTKILRPIGVPHMLSKRTGVFPKSRPQLLGFVGLKYGMPSKELQKIMFTLLDLGVASLRRGNANLLCIVPMLTDDRRRESQSPY